MQKIIKQYISRSSATLLPEAIQAQYVNGVAVPGIRKKINHSPWRTIPSIINFRLKLQPKDVVFKFFGIEKRKGKPHLWFEKGKNTRKNRYIIHEIEVLKRYQTEPRKYWTLSRSLIKDSTCFRLLAINHIFNNWYKDLPLSYVLHINKKVDNLISQGSLAEFQHSRVYIPKPPSSYRPLGVPTPEWRVLLHMYNQFLTYFLQSKLQFQHGFLPEKGTLSAWEEIFAKRLYEKPYIYEYDFKKYFDSVNIATLSKLLLNKYQVDPSVVSFLENVNRSIPKFASADQLDESQKRNQMRSQYNFKHGIFDIKDPVYNPLKEYLSIPGNMLSFWREIEEGPTDNLFEHYQYLWACEDPRFFLNGGTPTDWIGCAQGSPCSPILANVMMQEWVEHVLSQGYEIICYADDFIIFGDRPINVTFVPKELGVEINWSKSSYVKEDGHWLKPLKFLGLEYTQRETSTMWSANTRKGSKAQFSIWYQWLIIIKNHLNGRNFDKREDFITWLKESVTLSADNKQSSAPTWEHLFGLSRNMGWVQAMLYQGGFTKSKPDQDFTLTGVEKSWYAKYKKPHHTLATVSTYALYWLGNLLKYERLQSHRRNLKHRVKTPRVPGPKS